MIPDGVHKFKSSRQKICPYFGFKCETFLVTGFEFVYVVTAFYFSIKIKD